MINIEEFPNEILINIFKNCDFNSLVRLYYTNKKFRRIVVYIVQNNINKNRKLRVLSKYGDINAIKLLVNCQCNIDSKNRAGNTSLIIASYWGHCKIVKLLLNIGANYDLQNYKGNTALLISIEQEDIDIVRLLLNKGANINIKNNNGDTAISICKTKIKKFVGKQMIKLLKNYKKIDN